VRRLLALPKKKKKAPRTPKQIAAAKKNIRKAIAASKKARRNLGHKTNKQKRSRSRPPMPRKKKSRSKSRPGKKSFIDRIPILNNPTVQKVGFGLGMGVIVKDLINLTARFAPNQISDPLQKNERIITLAVEAATEPISAVVDLVTTGLTRNNSSNVGMNTSQDMVGFA